MEIAKVIALLQRFPQQAHLVVIGDRGMDDLRVEVENPTPPGSTYFRLDTDENDLWWLRNGTAAKSNKG